MADTASGHLHDGVATALAPGLLLVAVALLLLRLLVTGEDALYVGPLVRGPLWACVPVLAAAGAWYLWDAVRRRPAVGHEHGTRRVWILLTVPVLIGGLFGPSALTLVTGLRPASGSAGGALPSVAVGGGISQPLRGTGAALPTVVPSRAPSGAPPVAIDPRTGQLTGGYGQQQEVGSSGSSRSTPIGPFPTSWPALHGDPAPVSVYDYVARSLHGGASTLAGRSVSLEGFVSADPDNPAGPWVVARLKIWCCAADALPFMVTAVGARPVTPGTWVRVVGTYLPPAKGIDAALEVRSVTAIAAPKDPYLW